MIYYFNFSKKEKDIIINYLKDSINNIDFFQENGFEHAFVKRIINETPFIFEEEQESLNEFCYDTGYDSDDYFPNSLGEIVLKHEDEMNVFFEKERNNQYLETISKIRNIHELKKNIESNKLFPIVSSQEAYYYLKLYAKSIDQKDRIDQGLGECVWGWYDDKKDGLDNENIDKMMNFLENIILPYLKEKNIYFNSEHIFREDDDIEEFQELRNILRKKIFIYELK